MGSWNEDERDCTDKPPCDRHKSTTSQKYVPTWVYAKQYLKDQRQSTYHRDCHREEFIQIDDEVPPLRDISPPPDVSLSTKEYIPQPPPQEPQEKEILDSYHEHFVYKKFQYF